MTVNVILEGPDGSGKSTLASRMSDNFRTQVIHDGGPSKTRQDCIERIQKVIDDMENDTDDIIKIRDRSTIFSDGVYKRAFSEEPLIEGDLQESLLADFVYFFPIVIYCRPPIETIRENSLTLARNKPHKPADYVDQVAARIDNIVREYDEHMIRWSCAGVNIVQYDYTLGLESVLFSALQKEIDNERY